MYPDLAIKTIGGKSVARRVRMLNRIFSAKYCTNFNNSFDCISPPACPQSYVHNTLQRNL